MSYTYSVGDKSHSCADQGHCQKGVLCILSSTGIYVGRYYPSRTTYCLTVAEIAAGWVRVLASGTLYQDASCLTCVSWMNTFWKMLLQDLHCTCKLLSYESRIYSHQWLQQSTIHFTSSSFCDTIKDMHGAVVMFPMLTFLVPSLVWSLLWTTM